MTLRSLDAATELQAVAAETLDLLDSGRQTAPFSSRLAHFDLDEAYRVTAAVRQMRETRGERVLGRKIGFTNRTIWDQYGVYEPIFGYMYDRTVTYIPDRVWDIDGHGPEGALSLDGLTQPLLEPEIVFQLRAPPPLTDDPVALLRSIAWVGHGVEIVQCHFPDWKFAVADTIADGGLHGHYAVGLGVWVDDTTIDLLAERLSSFRLTLIKGRDIAATGGGDLVLGSPLNALAHLVRTLAALPDHPPLEAGELVTTGTLTTALPVTPGETWFTRLHGLMDFEGLTLRLV
jgi:2-oxo-3-hexenedioate decarboxylase